jgi:hypothetical protein
MSLNAVPLSNQAPPARVQAIPGPAYQYTPRAQYQEARGLHTGGSGNQGYRNAAADPNNKDNYYNTWSMPASTPLAPVQPSDPFSRRSLGMLLPGTENEPFQRFGGPYVPLQPPTEILPGDTDQFALIRGTGSWGQRLQARQGRFAPIQTTDRNQPYTYPPSR